MNDCITDEIALQMIFEPDSVSGETMAHVYVCEHCQGVLKANFDDVLYDCLDEQADNLAAAQNLWIKFENAYNAHLQRFGSRYGTFVGSALVSFFSFGVVPGACFGAAGSFGGNDIFCKLQFEANRKRYDKNFWSAELLVPKDISENAKLLFCVSDKNNLPLGNVVLKFADFNLPIKNGIAKISLEDFRKSLKTPKISVVFSGNDEVDGELVLFEKK